jgi:hypothetical protein
MVGNLSGNPGDGELIEMEEPGPIVEWWNSRSESTKTIIKAVAIGASIFLGKKIFNAISKRWQETKVEEMEEVIEDDGEDEGEFEEEEE